MKPKFSKTEAIERINDFFKRETFTSEEMKKIKRLAMKYKIKLLPHKKKFCKSCLLPLKGKIRISKTHKTIECSHCKHRNKFIYK